ncbi:MAG: glycosyltransferase, partial [Candidatus Margulisiibacteriota bacterium]
LAVCGIPEILIPYPYAAENHQQANAEKYAQAKAAVIINSLSPQALESIIRTLYFDREKLGVMAQNMRKLAKPEACEEIWKRSKKAI